MASTPRASVTFALSCATTHCFVFTSAVIPLCLFIFNNFILHTPTLSSISTLDFMFSSKLPHSEPSFLTVEHSAHQRDENSAKQHKRNWKPESERESQRERERDTDRERERERERKKSADSTSEIGLMEGQQFRPFLCLPFCIKTVFVYFHDSHNSSICINFFLSARAGLTRALTHTHTHTHTPRFT